MFSKNKIAFIGSGVMGEAMVQGVLRKKLMPASQIRISDPRKERVDELKKQYPGVLGFVDNKKAIADADIVVLSIKPQMLRQVAGELKGKIGKDKLVISILAGATLENLSEALAHRRIVRAMPNTPARIGLGMTVWTQSQQVNESHTKLAQTLFASLGEELRVEREDELDMATALSGTGPAYVFLFMEALIDAGVHLGFSRRVASQLVMQTVKGAVEFAMQSPNHLAELRNQVTSPGGTSAEALYQLEKGGLRTVISKSVWWAFKKSVALSKL